MTPLSHVQDLPMHTSSAPAPPLEAAPLEQSPRHPALFNYTADLSRAADSPGPETGVPSPWGAADSPTSGRGALLGPPVRGRRRKLIGNPVTTSPFTLLGSTSRIFYFADPSGGAYLYGLGAWSGLAGFRFVQAGAWLPPGRP